MEGLQKAAAQSRAWKRLWGREEEAAGQRALHVQDKANEPFHNSQSYAAALKGFVLFQLQGPAKGLH